MKINTDTESAMPTSKQPAKAQAEQTAATSPSPDTLDQPSCPSCIPSPSPASPVPVPPSPVPPTPVPVTGLGTSCTDAVMRGAAQLLRTWAGLPGSLKTQSSEAAIRSAVDGVMQKPGLGNDNIAVLKGFSTQPDGVITLEPAWHKARAFVWLLGIRQQVLDKHNLQAEAHLKVP